jgi:drug/metabolite transporter (DMT)-like permease
MFLRLSSLIDERSNVPLEHPMALSTSTSPVVAAPASSASTRMSPQAVGSTMAVTTALIWGVMFAVAASALHHVDSYHLTLVRYAAASVLFVALLVRREGLSALRTEGRGLRLFVLGSLGFAGFNLFTYLALGHMSPASASLVVAMSPLVAAVVGWIASGVRPAAGILLAGAGAVLGVAVVLGHGNPLDVVKGTAGPASLLVLVGVICFVLYTRGAAEFPGWSPLRFTTLTAVLGTVMILIATEVAQTVGAIGTPGLHDYSAVLPQIVYMVGLAAVVAVLGWNGAVARIGVVHTSVFITLVPVTAFVVDVLRGATLHLGDVLGIAIVIASIVGANLVQRRQLASRPAA